MVSEPGIPPAFTVAELTARLLDEFGTQGWWPLADLSVGEVRYSPGQWRSSRSAAQIFEIGVGAILTQRSTWLRVVPVLIELAAASGLDPDGLLAISSEGLAATIRPCGTFRRKADSLRAWAVYCRDHELTGAPPTDLAALPGFGPETRDCVLLYGFGVPVFIADAYARRILERMGYLERSGSYEALQRQVHQREALDRATCDEGHALLVELGKNFCRPRPRCESCPVRDLCRYAMELASPLES